MPNLQTITDVPVLLSATGTGPATSRMQVAKLGENFVDPRYGKFKITQSHFDKWQENHKKLFGSEGAPVDLDHSPETRGDTKAVGWMTTLEQKGTELWSTVEWTPEGAGHVQSKAYKFVSPSYVEKAKLEDGTDIGTVLRGAALTNRPFLKMAAVNLSRSAVDAIVPGVEEDRILHLEPWADERDTHAAMGLIDDLRKVLSLPSDASEEIVLNAAKAAADKATIPPEPPDPKTLSAMASAEGFILLTSDDHGSLVTAATSGAAAAKQLHEARVKTAFSDALNDPRGARVLPAQEEGLKTLFEDNPEATLSLIEGMPNLVSGEPKGHRGERVTLSTDPDGAEPGQTVDDDRQALHERAMTLSQEKSIPYGDAIILASTEG